MGAEKREGHEVSSIEINPQTDIRMEKHEAEKGKSPFPLIIKAAIILTSVLIVSILYWNFILPKLLPWSDSQIMPDKAVSLPTPDYKEALTKDKLISEGDGKEQEAMIWGDDEIFALLIIGNDYDYSKKGARSYDSPGRADTIMLLLMPRYKQTATLVSIPRDTMVTNATVSSSVKINTLYKGSPPEALMRKVAEITGIRVDRWLSMNFAGFENLVDLLGGVEISVDKRMRYTDVAGGYHIDLQPGRYNFNGKEALTYVRYRSDTMGDIARVERQLGFVKALAVMAVSWDTAGKLFGLAYLAKQHLLTDIGISEALAIGSRLYNIGHNNVDYWKLPGYFYGTYWHINISKLQAALQSSL